MRGGPRMMVRRLRLALLARALAVSGDGMSTTGAMMGPVVRACGICRSTRLRPVDMSMTALRAMAAAILPARCVRLPARCVGLVAVRGG